VQHSAFCISWGPNAVTCLRGILGVWIGIHLRHHFNTLLVLLFILAITSDVLDGWWARTCHITSKWGAILDPLADKAMTLSILSALTVRHMVPYWFFYLIIIKEVGLVLGGICAVHLKWHVPLGAIFWGKLSMLSQCVLILLAMMRIQYSCSHSMYDVYVWIVAALNAVTCIVYILRAQKRGFFL
jgi:cardiolipin synthase